MIYSEEHKIFARRLLVTTTFGFNCGIKIYW